MKRIVLTVTVFILLFALCAVSAGAQSKQGGRGDIFARIVLNGPYYLSGNINFENVCFYDNGRVLLDYPGESYECDYSLDGNMINIYKDGKDKKPLTLTIIDAFTLEAENKEKYIRSPGINDAVQIDDHVFYIPGVITKGDPGDNLSAPDAAKLACEALRDILQQVRNDNGYNASAGQRNIYIILTGPGSVADKECYLYKIGVGAAYETGDYYTLYQDVAVNYDGTVYILSMKSGEWEMVK